MCLMCWKKRRPDRRCLKPLLYFLEFWWTTTTTETYLTPEEDLFREKSTLCPLTMMVFPLLSKIFPQTTTRNMLTIEWSIEMVTRPLPETRPLTEVSYEIFSRV